MASPVSTLKNAQSQALASQYGGYSNALAMNQPYLEYSGYSPLLQYAATGMRPETDYGGQISSAEEDLAKAQGMYVGGPAGAAKREAQIGTTEAQLQQLRAMEEMQGRLGGMDLNALVAQTPGYQFAQQQGEQAMARRLSGPGGPGAASSTATGLYGNQANALAGQYYDKYLQNLYNMTGIGQGTAQGIGQNALSTGQNVANTWQNMGQQIAGAQAQDSASGNALTSSLLSGGLQLAGTLAGGPLTGIVSGKLASLFGGGMGPSDMNAPGAGPQLPGLFG